MKTLTLMLLLSTKCYFSQSSINEDSLKIVQDKEYESTDKMMMQLGRTRSQFSNIQYNYVSSRLQLYMENSMNMHLISDDVNIKNNKITLVFEEKSSVAGSLRKLKFTFDTYTIGTLFYIKKCSITGNDDKLTYFFVDYWRQNIQYDELKTGIFKTMCIADDIVLTLKPNLKFIEVKAR